jgi:hypothetical protein
MIQLVEAKKAIYQDLGPDVGKTVVDAADQIVYRYGPKVEFRGYSKEGKVESTGMTSYQMLIVVLEPSESTPAFWPNELWEKRDTSKDCSRM